MGTVTASIGHAESRRRVNCAQSSAPLMWPGLDMGLHKLKLLAEFCLCSIARQLYNSTASERSATITSALQVVDLCAQLLSYLFVLHTCLSGEALSG